MKSPHEYAFEIRLRSIQVGQRKRSRPDCPGLERSPPAEQPSALHATLLARKVLAGAGRRDHTPRNGSGPYKSVKRNIHATSSKFVGTPPPSASFLRLVAVQPLPSNARRGVNEFTVYT
ncbi:hypothetical protein ACLOJK_002535 [Asimina triloba]